MLQEYLYEIIAMIFIVTLLIIYLLTLKFKKDERDVLEGIKQKDKKIVKNIQVEPLKKDIPPTRVIQKEKAPISNKIITEKPKTKKVPPPPTKKYRQKVEVPAHRKTIKDDFKEFAGVKILVAEDNIINQKVIHGLLADSGIITTMADDGQFALEILEQDPDYNFILMDAHMPRIDGFQATRTIRANRNYDHIVIVALSGDIAADDVKRMKDSGMEEHLEKPLRMDGLYDILYAYTYAIRNKEASTTKQLNSQQGLEVCGNDKEFYKDILNEFLRDYTDSPKKLASYLKDENTRAADSLLLDFIGVTANIGANNINNIALELKESIKNIKSKSCTQLLKKYTKHLEVLIGEIKEYTK